MSRRRWVLITVSGHLWATDDVAAYEREVALGRAEDYVSKRRPEPGEIAYLRAMGMSDC